MASGPPPSLYCCVSADFFLEDSRLNKQARPVKDDAVSVAIAGGEASRETTNRPLLTLP